MHAKEYETLRTELNENRKYVFERPLIILTASLFVFQKIDNTFFIPLLFSLVIFVFIFNLNFTCNRLNSSARIIAYIRIFIEQSQDSEKFYWETFLSEYRKRNEKDDNRILNDETRNSTDNLRDKGFRYYKIIYGFHVFIMGLFLVSEVSVFVLLCKHLYEAIIPIIINGISIYYIYKIWDISYPPRVNEIFFKESIIVQRIYDEKFKKIDSTPPNEPSAEQCGRFPEAGIRQTY
jgi:hypothetical protein